MTSLYLRIYCRAIKLSLIMSCWLPAVFFHGVSCPTTTIWTFSAPPPLSAPFSSHPVCGAKQRISCMRAGTGFSALETQQVLCGSPFSVKEKAENLSIGPKYDFMLFGSVSPCFGSMTFAVGKLCRRCYAMACWVWKDPTSHARLWMRVHNATVFGLIHSFLLMDS